MAKVPSKQSPSSQLFTHQQIARLRRARRQGALFIPRFLKEAAASQQLAGAAQDAAHKMLLKWHRLPHV